MKMSLFCNHPNWYPNLPKVTKSHWKAPERRSEAYQAVRPVPCGKLASVSGFMNRWSKIALIVAGASLALGALMSLLLKTQRQAPPSPISWDSRAVEATFEGVRVREVDATHAALVLLYDLTNTTGSDYRLEKDSSEVIMSRLKPGGILSSDTQVVLDNAAFIPAGSRTRIAIEMDGPFNWPARHDAAAERALRQ